MKQAQRIGERVQRARKDRGVSQAELASRTGLDRASVSQIENGHSMPRTSTLLKIADALRIDASRLLSESESLSPTGGTDLPSPHQGGNPEPDRTGITRAGVYYAPLEDERLHPGLEELLADERTRLMLGLTPEEEEMLRSVRTRRDAPLGRDFFIDVLIAYRRHRSH
ncbi:helix-turn-helix domain-containing protein [bacterium]|nr:helix-turn-helix domain-containing protein [bacterium]